MGRAANLSPLGLYEWDNTLFDLMTIPEALNKETLVENLLAETAELEVLYPNPIVFKNLLGVWSAKQLDIWERLWQTTQYEYNPIENYDRIEEGADEGTDTTTHSGTDRGTSTTTHGGTDVRTNSVTDGGADSSTKTMNAGHWIAGFDSVPAGSDDGLVKQTRDEGSENNTFNYGKTETAEEHLTKGTNEQTNTSTTHGEQVSRQSSGEHQLRAHGNIGVTTTQKLIREQRAIDLFNLYDIIIEDFKMRFCILVY